MAILNNMRGKRFIAPLAGLAIGSGIAGLGGLFSGGKSAPSAEDIAGQFGPEQLRALQEALFNLIGGGASFQGQLARSNILGQSAGQRIAASSARKGLSSTGVGAIASGIGSQLLRDRGYEPDSPGSSRGVGGRTDRGRLGPIRRKG